MPPTHERTASATSALHDARTASPTDDADDARTAGNVKVDDFAVPAAPGGPCATARYAGRGGSPSSWDHVRDIRIRREGHMCSVPAGEKLKGTCASEEKRHDRGDQWAREAQAPAPNMGCSHKESVGLEWPRVGLVHRASASMSINPGPVPLQFAACGSGHTQ